MSILTEGAERETIARIIDPGAFADRDNNVGPRDRTIKLAFDKADSILALRDHAPKTLPPDMMTLREALRDCVAFLKGDIFGPAQKSGIIRDAEAALQEAGR